MAKLSKRAEMRKNVCLVSRILTFTILIDKDSVKNTLKKCEIYTKSIIIFNTFWQTALNVEKYIINININLILVIVSKVIFAQKIN